MNDKPRFAKAHSKANELLVASSVITTFPFSPIKLVKERTSFVCRTYAKAQKYGVDMSRFGSESAVIVSLNGKAIIFYDDSKPEAHVNFSILHEMGHPLLGHDPHVKDREEYAQYEVETNWFAAQLLMPEQLLREMITRGAQVSPSFLQSNFGVSDAAARKRLETLAKTNAEWRSREEKEFDDIILQKFAPFLDQICPRQSRYSFEDELDRQQERDSWLY